MVGEHSEQEVLRIPVSHFFWLLTGWSALATIVSTLTIIFLVNWTARFEIGAIRGELTRFEAKHEDLEVRYGVLLNAVQAKQDTLYKVKAEVARLRRGVR
mgnify:CR=1 FL=1